MTVRPDPAAQVDHWRSQLVRTILRIMFAAGVLLAVPSVTYAISTGQTSVAVVDALAVVSLTALTFHPSLHQRTRAVGLIVTAYLLGLWLLLTIGLINYVYLLAVPVFAALLIGLRAAVIGLIGNAVTLLGAGLWDPLGRQLELTGTATLVEWLVLTANFLFVNSVLAISCAVLLKRLERSLSEEQSVSEALDRQRDDLQVAYADLHREMLDRERAEAEADRLSARADRAERLEALGTLARGAAHDFNNVLGSILAVAENAHARTDDPAARHELAAIIGACDRARDIVQQLMVFGERSPIGREPVVVSKVIESSLPLWRATLPAGVHLEVQLRSDRSVVARPSEIDQILANLIANAGQALTRSGGGRITVGLQGSSQPSTGSDAADNGRPMDHLLLTVSDDGPGIEPDHLASIFEPFFTTRAGSGGTGLGLASVHAIVGSLGGDISVDSQLGRGTTFTVRLPASEATDVPPAHEATARAIESGEARPPQHVLFVDDEELIRSMAAAALTQSGYLVTTATDGREALSLIEDGPIAFDLLITDVTMPRLDGVHRALDNP